MLWVLWWIGPLFLTAIHLTLPGSFVALLNAVVPILALLYVFFAPAPKTPF